MRFLLPLHVVSRYKNIHCLLEITRHISISGTLKYGATSTRLVHSRHLANFYSEYEATWYENQRKNPDTPVTTAETINIFIYDKIYEILFVSKNGKQILKDQKTLFLFMKKYLFNNNNNKKYLIISKINFIIRIIFFHDKILINHRLYNFLSDPVIFFIKKCH